MNRILKALESLKDARANMIKNIKRYGQADFVRKNIVDNELMITEAQVSNAIKRGYFTEKQVMKLVFIPTFAPQLGTPLNFSPRVDLDFLLPSMPAEDIVDGKLVRHELQENENSTYTELHESSKCVWFGRESIETILTYNPCIKGYIYTPKKEDVEFREFWEECQVIEPDFDCVAVKEIRCYAPVAVECIGEFETDFLGEEKYKVIWY